MILEFMKFIAYSIIIVIISKYILVGTLRKLAENLSLKPKTIGDVAGYATSIPELLTITVSSFTGLSSASIFNVLSSNVINLFQYIFTIIINKNIKLLKNKAIFIDLILVIITILIPLLLIIFNVDIQINLIPIFIIIYVLFRFINNNVNKLYLTKEDQKLEQIIEKEEKWEKGNKRKTIKYISIILVTAILLFFVGELLGKVLQNLANIFNVSEMIIGILLGVITSIPELITFLEAQKHYRNKKVDDILGVVEATNNLFTSNIMNLFVIQTIGILVYAIFFKLT